MSNSKIYLAFIILIIVIFVGIGGYIWIGDLSFVDALYMTIITISTVGFREVIELDNYGKVFTSCLILVSIGVYGYCISVISEYMIKGTFIKELKYKKMIKNIKNLRGHVIICGLGRNGKAAAMRLDYHKKDFVIIDNSEEALEGAKNKNFFYVKGDATKDSVLMDAGIKHAKYLISALPEDTDNLFIVLSSKHKNKDLKIISKVQDESSVEKFKEAGAYRTIMPNILGGVSMASLVTKPNVMEFWKNIFTSKDSDINIEEIDTSDFIDKGYKHLSIKDLNFKDKYGCNIIGYKKADGKYIVNPADDIILNSGEKLIVIGSYCQIKNIKVEKK